jgi:two-component system, NtrC family, sensor kinase
MSTQTSSIDSIFLEAALNRRPQFVTPESSLRGIIEKISHLNTSCPLFASIKSPDSPESLGANISSGYVLVVPPSAITFELNQLKISDILGIVTVPDIVRAIAQKQILNNLTISDVMNQSFITVNQSDVENIVQVAHLWREKGNYPVLLSDPSGFFLGAIAPYKMVQQIESGKNWLKSHSVKNVLTNQAIQAHLTDSLEEIAKIMVKNQASYVLLFEKLNAQKEAISQPENIPTPLGIVTDQDIVNYWAIDLDLSTIKAKSVIDRSLRAIDPEASLWSAQKSMEQWQTSALVVYSDRGEFMGVIDRTSWLKTLDPAEMYRTMVQLQQNLESKTEALDRTNTELQSEIVKRINAENNLEIIQKNLPSHAAECTDELKVANEQLKQEILRQQEVEAALRKSEAQSREQARQLEIAIEKLQKTQAKLIQMEKMSGLGQLVAGIAHEINNPINFIYGNITHATTYITDILKLLHLYQKTYPNSSDEIEEIIEEIELDFLMTDLPKLLHSMQAGAERIRQIVQSLRNFSRLDEAAVKEVDLHEGLESTLMILQHRLKGKLGKPNIEIYKDYGNLPKVECHPSLLNQVFMNLLNNALDALENEEAPQLIKIKTRAFTVDTSQLENSYDSAWVNNYVRISILDNGRGMDETVQKRLFEPFFTTKPVGKGTGLGLSISYQIVVEKHYGRLDVISAPDRGTELIIEIPVKPTNRPEPPLFEAAES